MCLLRNLKWSLRKIAKKDFIRRRNSNFRQEGEKTGTNRTATRFGSPRKTTKRDDSFIVTHSKRNRKLTVREIAAELNRTKVESVSSKPVARHLCDVGLRGRVAVRKPLLRKLNVAKQLNEPKNIKIEPWTNGRKYFGSMSPSLNFSIRNAVCPSSAK